MPTCYDIAHGELPPGDTLRCGNRRDLPKKQRVHHWQDLGPDGRNYNGGYTEGTVRACQACGADQFRREAP